MAQARKTRTRRGRRTNKRPTTMVVKSPGITAYQQLLADPCGGTVQSYYGGETGIVQRFSRDLTINTVAGHTAGFIMFNPAGNNYFSNSGTTAATVLTSPVNPGPGSNFLGNVMTKMRAVAACVTVLPSAASMTNITGEIAVAVVSSDLINTVGSYSVDGLFSVCQKRAVLQKKEYDVKWFPGSLDHTYNPATAGATGTANISDVADSNGILVCYKGWVPGIGISIRLTNIIEWTPFSNIGLTVTSVPRAPNNPHKEAAELHARNPSWWHRLGDEVGQDLSMAARYVGRLAMAQGVKRVERYLTQAAPAVISGLL